MSSVRTLSLGDLSLLSLTASVSSKTLAITMCRLTNIRVALNVNSSKANCPFQNECLVCSSGGRCRQQPAVSYVLVFPLGLALCLFSASFLILVWQAIILLASATRHSLGRASHPSDSLYRKLSNWNPFSSAPRLPRLPSPVLSLCLACVLLLT